MPTSQQRRRARGLSAAQRADLRRDLERELGRLGTAADGRYDAAAPDLGSPAPRARAARLLDALRRMTSAEFGVCSGCRRPNAFERLSVLPETTLCARCTRRRETAWRT